MKKTVNVKTVLIVLAAIVTISCMFLNWVPVDVDLGITQMEEVLGTINALSLNGLLNEVNDALGLFADYIPEEFDAMRSQSMLLMLCACATILCNVVAAYFSIIKKERITAIALAAAAIGSVLTCMGFYSLINDFVRAIGINNAEKNVISVILASPYTAVLVSGVVCGMLAVPYEIWENLIDTCVTVCVSTVKNLVFFVAEIIGVIFGNIGFIVSDVIGAVSGVMVGKIIVSATEMTLLGVMVGLITAGLAAYACCMIACQIFGYSKEVNIANRS